MINIKTDSRKVKPGDTFVAIKGFTVDGHDYIEQAIKNGATKIICEKGSYSVDTEKVPNSKKWLQEYIVNNYKDELNDIKLIGVTGTNGKTTTCYLVYQMLKELGAKVAYMGTIGFYFEDKMKQLPNTTPEILDVYSLIIDAKEKGATHFVMEVSSHALSEKRVEGLLFSAEAFTNLTEDHLDFHKTMDNYLQAKLLILNQLKENGKIIVNNDVPYAKEFEQKNYETLGFSGNDYKILNYKDTSNGTKITFSVNDKEYEVETNLKTKFNVYNYLTCVAIVKNMGYEMKDILSVTPSIYPPKGRCEAVKVGDAQAVIDYAHTPDAVEKIIDAFNEDKKGKIITLVGCGGDRDPLKRPIMGSIASNKSDYVIFTNDNPRTEDPEKIMKDILKGVDNKNYEVILDRKQAINRGLSMLKKDDVLLILGKGHEDYQIIGHEKRHFSDLEEVENYNRTQNFTKVRK